MRTGMGVKLRESASRQQSIPSPFVCLPSPGTTEGLTEGRADSSSSELEPDRVLEVLLNSPIARVLSQLTLGLQNSEFLRSCVGVRGEGSQVAKHELAAIARVGLRRAGSIAKGIFYVQRLSDICEQRTGEA